MMLKIAVVGCTGKLGSAIIKKIINSDNAELSYAVARQGNQFAGHKVTELIGEPCELTIIDNIENAVDCDVFIDCTNAENFMGQSFLKYKKMAKPLIIATTAFSDEDIKIITESASYFPVFMEGNFSIELHNFIETLKFAARNVSSDTDIQIIEYHHNQKKDAPSGTAIMIKQALVGANPHLNTDAIKICSVRAGNIFGEHEVIFANSSDEVVTFKHKASSRDCFATGAIEVAMWLSNKKSGFYNMDDFCSDRI